MTLKQYLAENLERAKTIAANTSKWSPRMYLNRFQLHLIDRARHAAETAEKCILCGESHGRLIDGVHTICRALVDRGMMPPTWKRCPDCAGLGFLPKSPVGPVNPNQTDMEAWAPRCETCDGHGYVDFSYDAIDAPEEAS